MNLDLDKRITEFYSSPSQKVRVLTEGWVNREIYCPNCGQSLQQYPNNRKVADFYCVDCREDYELKSKKDGIGSKVLDGAYKTMLERLTSSSNPSFFFLSYSAHSWQVLNFLVIPKHFFTADIIEERKPLKPTARRAGWVGCNILLQSIPEAGKIYFVRNCKAELRDRVVDQWRRTLFLREERGPESRGWTLSVMRCIDRLAKKEFLLDDVYAFEKKLGEIYPDNKHIKDKIRQQLQILRDKGYLEFIGRGKYRLPAFEYAGLTGREAKKRRDLAAQEERFIDQIEKEINEKLKFVEYLPVCSLEAVATGFKEEKPMPEALGWMKVDSKRKLKKDMFIAKVIGKSMEPTIPDGSWCIFRPDQGGSRNGKIVVVESRRVSDPETGKYTIKRYKSEKIATADSFAQTKIVLIPDNKEFNEIVLENIPEGELHVVAELVEVLR